MLRRASTSRAALRVALFLVLGGVSLPVSGYAQTADIRLAWDPPGESGIEHYNVYVGTSPGSNDVDILQIPGSQTNAIFAAAPGVLYYFAVTAVNDEGIEGARSSEISGAVPSLSQPSNRISTFGVPIVPTQLLAFDPDGGTLRFSHTGLPPGLILNSTSGLITGSPASIGTFAVTIFVSDGLMTTSRSFTWTVRNDGTGDTTAPMLVITSHTDGQSVPSANITVTGTASDGGLGDNGIASVRVNGVLATGGTASGDGTASWSRSLTLPSNNQVLVEAQDGAGNYSALFLTLARDATGPAISITSHTPGQIVNTSSITLSGTATDQGMGGNGVTSITVNGTAATGGTAAGSAVANWSRTVTLVSGANTLTVVATDTSGNRRTVQITITRDSTLPALSITSHSSGQTVSTGTGTITLSGTATDSGAGGSGITGVAVNGALASGGVASGSSTATWSRTLTLSIGANAITVSASDGAGNMRTTTLTLTYSPPAILTVDGVSPNSGSGTSQTFALQYSSNLGASNISMAWVWFNETFASVSNDSCMLYYDRPRATLYLLNDSANTWMPGTLGSGTTLQNSQCAVSLGGSSVTAAGNSLTLNLAMTFRAAFAGTKNVYMYEQNVSNANSGWLTRGTWTVSGSGTTSATSALPITGPTTVTADSATPNGGSGASQTFALQYSSNLGAANISTAWVWFNATFAAASNNSCMLYYDRPRLTLYLLNNSASTWMSGTLGSGATLQNSQCAVSLGGSSVTASGNNLTLNLAMTFKAAYAGAKNVYMYAQNVSDVNSGWQTRGTWTVPGSVLTTVTADSATPNEGFGASQTFALQYSSNLGASNISTAWVWFNETFAAVSNNSCMLYYDRSRATLYLLNNSATTWMSGVLGTFATLQNSQCAVSLSGSSVTLSGNSLTLNLAMTFKAAYAGAKNVYMYAQNANNVNSDWQGRGIWTVP